MGGRLIYVVGPSGSGKDSILQGVVSLLPADCVIMQRVITRQAFAQTEDSEFLAKAEFDALEQAGGLALSWRANGLAYGVRSELDQWLKRGIHVLINGSRAHWPTVQQQYPNAILVSVHVDAELLRQRLISRGRESLEQINERLLRNLLLEQQLREQTTLSQNVCWEIDNSGALNAAVQQLREQIQELVTS